MAVLSGKTRIAYGNRAELYDREDNALENLILKNISILKDKSIMVLNTDKILQLPEITDTQLLGFGLDGYAVASYYGALLKVDVGFIRTESKTHGTKKNVDGVIDAQKDICLFVEESKIDFALLTTKKYGLHIRYVYSFSSEERTLPKSGDIVLYPEYTLPKCCEENISEYVNYIYSDDGFLLSSGLKSNRYIETLPAANTYSLINYIIHKYQSFLESFDAFVGIGYGGIFFSVVSAIALSKRFFVFDAASTDSHKYHSTGSFLFFDDFISTGKNLGIANKFFHSDCQNGAIVLYAKENIKYDLADLRICSIIE